MEQAISIAIRKAELLYDYLNGLLFNSELKRPVIFINEDTTKGAYGWYTPKERWNGKEANYKEIVICADYLRTNDWTKTLLHEMTHQYNDEILHVKDTSRSGTYHNSEFKKACITHGQICERSEKYGWSITKPTEEIEAKIKEFLKGYEITIERQKTRKTEKIRNKNSHSIKYICPICNSSVRATKEVNIACMDCHVLMEKC